MTVSTLTLHQFPKEKDFLIAVDSDGCVFDTMEAKTGCIISAIIADWGLEAIAGLVRETAEFVNLHSIWRGMNRFLALVKIFDLLADRVEIAGGGFPLPAIEPLRNWVERETQLSTPSLEKVSRESGDPVLLRTLQWTLHVNKAMDQAVRGTPSFRFVRESLEKIAARADILVASTTTQGLLIRDWREHDYAKYVKAFAGQEMGIKKETLALVMKNRYPAERVLMIGDARGDQLAAKANHASFYPIIPGGEGDSWQRFYEKDLERFLKGQYAGAYEAKLSAVWDQSLPAKPSWVPEAT